MSFDPAECGLCGGREAQTMIERPPPSLTSDGRASRRRLYKVACGTCGLVRNGDAFTALELEEHYAVDYELGRRGALAEPVVFGGDGPVARSKALAGWIADAVAAPPGSVLEVGCGEGSVLLALREHWPDAALRGVDLSPEAVATARDRGLDVEVASYDDTTGTYDLVFSIAVVEHVPSPLDFFERLAGLMSAKGLLVSIQPVQDAPSIDVFFSDHLHHFTTAHVAAFGARAGLRELSRATDHSLLPTFSRHAFELGATELALPKGSGAVGEAATVWNEVFDAVDAWSADLAGRRLAVWGAGQTSEAFTVYTRLGDIAVDAVLDDNPARFADGWRNVPVNVLEESAVEGSAWAVLLTFRPQGSVIARLEARGIDCYYFAV